MKHINEKRARRLKRKKRIRKTIRGTADCPRVTVYKSNKHLYAQVIDDTAGNTLLSASNVESDLKDLKNNRENAQKIGEELGKRMKEAKIETAVFDRNGFVYHGLIKAVADGTRKAGIRF